MGHLTPGTAQPGTLSGWHTESRSALPGAPVSDSSSEPCGDCRSSGKSQQSPGNIPEEEGRCTYIVFASRNDGLSEVPPVLAMSLQTTFTLQTRGVSVVPGETLGDYEGPGHNHPRGVCKGRADTR